MMTLLKIVRLLSAQGFVSAYELDEALLIVR